MAAHFAPNKLEAHIVKITFILFVYLYNTQQLSLIVVIFFTEGKLKSFSVLLLVTSVQYDNYSAIYFAPNKLKADTLKIKINSFVPLIKYFSAYTQSHLFSFPRCSLESEAGNFECSVSGLRWVCKEKVSFKYQFCSWEEPMERMEMLQYMPAGPLIDIAVIAGKLNEVYLPHWICIGKWM